MTSKQSFIRLSAIMGRYAPYKVQDAFDGLLVTSLVLLVALMLYGVYLMPAAGIIGAILGFSVIIILKITRAVCTVVKYLVKGD